MRYLTKLMLVTGGLGMLGTAVLADSISPSVFTADLNVGESVTVRKTVTVDEGRPTTSKVDVYFLADTTGSMGGAINGVKASAGALLASIAGLGDVQFAVGEYKDFAISPYGSAGDFPYRLNTAMTANQASAQAGINMWGASGGNDWPESNLHALKSLAEDPATGWRDGSKRLVVWFGDAYGHDSAAHPGPTEAATIAALQAASIQVEAIDVGSAGLGLDATGQATRITAATGGHKYTGPNNAAIVAVIQDAIEAAFATYNTVTLDLSEVPAGLLASIVPGSYVGDYDREETRTFEFDLTFTGVAPGDYSFNVYGLVDGGRVATESDRIRVFNGTSVPEGGMTLPLLGMAAVLFGLLRRAK